MNIDPVIGDNGEVELGIDNAMFIASLTGWSVYPAPDGTYELDAPQRFNLPNSKYATLEQAFRSIPVGTLINDTQTADQCIHMIRRTGAGRRAVITDGGNPFLGDQAQVKIEIDGIEIEDGMPVSIRHSLSFTAPTYEQAVMKMFIAVAPILRASAEIIQKFNFALNLEHHVPAKDG